MVLVFALSTLRPLELLSVSPIKYIIKANYLNTSHLDYCNSLLYGIPKYHCDRLQKILNAARVICVILKFDHITPFLMKLHWLPVYFRIQFTILLLVFKALEGKAPVYIRDLLKPKVAGDCCKSRIQSVINPLENKLSPIQVHRYGMPYL